MLNVYIKSHSYVRFSFSLYNRKKKKKRFDILENHCFLFDPLKAIRAFEYDYLIKVWSPMLEAIFAAKNADVRLSGFSH